MSTRGAADDRTDYDLEAMQHAATLIETARLAVTPRLSAVAAARAAGVSETTWHDVMQARRLVSQDSLLRMARAVGAEGPVRDALGLPGGDNPYTNPTERQLWNVLQELEPEERDELIRFYRFMQFRRNNDAGSGRATGSA